MFDKPMLLMIGTSLTILEISKPIMDTTGMEVVTSCSDYKKQTKGIAKLKPAAVIIWGVNDADDFLEFVRSWEGSDHKPFFVVTTCYRDVYRSWDGRLPENAYPILEPVSAVSLKELIQTSVMQGDLL